MLRKIVKKRKEGERKKEKLLYNRVNASASVINIFLEREGRFNDRNCRYKKNTYVWDRLRYAVLRRVVSDIQNSSGKMSNAHT